MEDDYYYQEAEKFVSEYEEKLFGNNLTPDLRSNFISGIKDTFYKHDFRAEKAMLDSFKEIHNKTDIRIDFDGNKIQKLQNEQRRYLQFIASLSLVILGIPLPLLYQQADIIQSLFLFFVGLIALLFTAIVSSFGSWYDLRLSIKASESFTEYNSMNDEYERQQAMKIFNISVMDPSKKITINNEIKEPTKTKDFEKMVKFSNKFYRNNNKLGWIQIVFFVSLIVIGMSFFIGL